MLTGLTASASRVARAYLQGGRPGRPANDPGIASLSAAERSDLKDRGRRLLLLLLDHLNEEPRRSSIKLTEADEEANQYGRRAATLGASLSATLEAFVRFQEELSVRAAAALSPSSQQSLGGDGSTRAKQRRSWSKAKPQSTASWWR